MNEERKQKVFFLDDDREFVDMISDVIKHPHFEISSHYVSNGAEALFAVMKARPDVLFIDFGLPSINGGQIMHHIKSHPEFADLRIYFVTGYPTEEVFPHLKGLDFEGLLVKGGTMESEILSILNNLDKTGSKR